MSGFFARMGERARGSEEALGLRPAQPFEPGSEEGLGEPAIDELEDGLELTTSGDEMAPDRRAARRGESEVAEEPQREPAPAEPASPDDDDEGATAPAPPEPPSPPRPAGPEEALPILARAASEEPRQRAPAAPEPSPPSPLPPPAPVAEPAVRGRAAGRRNRQQALRPAAPSRRAAPRAAGPAPKPAPAPEPRFDLATMLRDHVLPALAEQGVVDRDEKPVPPPAHGEPIPDPGEIVVEPAEVSELPAPSPARHQAPEGPAAVNVQIGRVTVTRAPAPPPPPSPPRRAATRPTVDHDAYLARRREQR